MRGLRFIAWSVFCLDLVILAQFGWWLLTSTDPLGRNIMGGVTRLLASGLLGIGVALAVSSWLRSRAGLWLSLTLALIPLCWVLGAIVQSVWQ